MKFPGLATFLTFCALTSCTTTDSGGNRQQVAQQGEWKADDLAAGPVEIIKAPFAALICPLRLADKEITGISHSQDGTASDIGNSLLIPFRGVFDGAFSGVGYLAGGAIDTVSGGALGIVSGATAEPEPNGSIHCAISGTSE